MDTVLLEILVRVYFGGFGIGGLHQLHSPNYLLLSLWPKACPITEVKPTILLKITVHTTMKP